MSATITQAFVQQFDDLIRLQAQQKDSRLGMAAVDRGNITGESFTANRLAPADDTPANTTRHGDTQWSEITHSTRVALMQDFYQALPVDRADRPKLLADPNSAYSASLLASWNRRKDRLHYGALLGNSQAKDGSLIALPAGQKIVAGGTAFTKSKLIAARAIFRAREADSNNGEELNIIYTSDMLTSILSDTTLTSHDYLAVKMLQEGDVTGKWMGFNWIPYEAITNSGGTKSTAAWCNSAIHKGTGFVEGKVQIRGDKKDTWQTSMAASYGVVRVEEEKVVQIDFI